MILLLWKGGWGDRHDSRKEERKRVRTALSPDRLARLEIGARGAMDMDQLQYPLAFIIYKTMSEQHCIPQTISEWRSDFDKHLL
jgi:hypothetical protein